MRGVLQAFADWLRDRPIKATPGTGLGRIEANRVSVSIDDVVSEHIYAKGDPLRIATADLGGARSFAAIPMLAGETMKGAITIYRQQVHPFSQHHVDLVDKFAGQPVIALENTRLLKQARSLSDELEALSRSLKAQVDRQVAELNRLAVLRRFLASQIAEAVMTSEDDTLLSSHRRKIAALFCDLRGFTAFSETAEPEAVMEVLETFHGENGNVIGEFQGTICHRSGDGMMVVLNDPVPIDDPAAQAARLAHALRVRTVELCTAWRRRGYELGTGIGLPAGYATLGLIGSENRYDYTAIGTVVNIASRFCDATAHGDMLLAQRAAAEIDATGQTEEAGKIQFKGMSR
jgi:adenylate cyclase